MLYKTLKAGYALKLEYSRNQTFHFPTIQMCLLADLDHNPNMMFERLEKFHLKGIKFKGILIL